MCKHEQHYAIQGPAYEIDGRWYYDEEVYCSDCEELLASYTIEI